jgi:hypothetical protein
MRTFRLISTVAVLGVTAASFLACSGGGGTGTGGAGTTTDTSASASSTSAAGTGGAGGGGSTTSAATTTSSGTGGSMVVPAGEDLTRDILTTDLELDLTALTGKATITIAGSTTSKAASFEIGDLDITKVSDDQGALEFATKTGIHGLAQLDIGVPSGATPAKIIVEYAFKKHTMFDGWMETEQLTFLWPYFCGNLYPCKSDPADGVAFTMKVTGAAAGMTAVFPASIPADAPSYMPAIAVAQFTKLDLGKTTKGTQVNAWFLPGQATDAAAGTAHLKQVFDFYEKTYGDYSFGTTVGSVSANWGPGAYGGMEHHPYWHVGKDDFNNEEVHAHEAAHGWYGDGVRIACWEDFVLSEGSATYLAARSLGTVGIDLFKEPGGYECQLKNVCDPAKGQNTIALPSTCNSIDILNDPLWSNVPYMKGAFFYQAVAKVIGVDVLDAAFAGFYKANVGKAAHMQAFIDYIKTKTDVAGAKAVDDLATAWLKTLDCPVDYTTLCP